jgi:hypothetical protein
MRRLAQLKKENPMLKAIVSYSKKIPVPDSEYSSQGYSLSLETEITAGDAPAIQAKLHETFELVKSSVEQELANGNGTGNGHTAKPTPAQPAPQAASRTGEKASNKQIKFLTDLATQRGQSLSDLNADVQRRFGVAGIYDLTRRDASALLDELNGRQRKAA